MYGVYGWIFDNSVPGLPEASAAEGLTPLEYMRRYGAFEISNKVGKVYAVYPASTNNIEFCTCFKTPCSDNLNILQDTITVK